jgi:hypothetical protein
MENRMLSVTEELDRILSSVDHFRKDPPSMRLSTRCAARSAPVERITSLRSARWMASE